MVSRFVLDCSVTMAWCFADEATEFTSELLRSLSSGREALVPAHWSLEVVNALLVSERRERVTRNQSSRFLALLQGLPIARDVETPDRSFSSVAELARETALTAYDAAYLELAVRRGVPIATLDGELHAAATRSGVALIGG